MPSSRPRKQWMWAYPAQANPPPPPREPCWCDKREEVSEMQKRLWADKLVQMCNTSGLDEDERWDIIELMRWAGLPCGMTKSEYAEWRHIMDDDDDEYEEWKAAGCPAVWTLPQALRRDDIQEAE